jgi:ribosomal protein S18 acetylase RimI-like enzyme
VVLLCHPRLLFTSDKNGLNQFLTAARKVKNMNIVRITEEHFDKFEGFLPDTATAPRRLILGYVEDGISCGALCLEYGAYGASLESIAVSPEHRRRGIGSRLMDEGCRILEKTSVRRLDAAVSGAENAVRAHVAFLEKNLFMEEERSPIFTLRLADVAACASLQEMSAHGTGTNIFPLRTVDPTQIQLFNRTLTSGANYIHPAIDPDSLDGDCSFFSFADDKIDGCILFSRNEDGSLTLDWLYASNAKPLSKLLASGFKAVTTVYSGDTLLHVATVSAPSRNLFDRLLDGCPKEETLCAGFSRLITL